MVRSRGHRDAIFEFQVGFCDSFPGKIVWEDFIEVCGKKIIFSFFFFENWILRASNEKFFRKGVKNTFFKHFLGQKMLISRKCLKMGNLKVTGMPYLSCKYVFVIVCRKINYSFSK